MPVRMRHSENKLPRRRHLFAALHWKGTPQSTVLVKILHILNMAHDRQQVKINVDLGEGFGNFKCGPDDQLIPLIDHANVACGFHAGDPLIMQETVRTCKKSGIAVGAHPGLPDIQGFGRREMKLSPEELTAMTRYQIGALKGFLDAEGVQLHHVKPHGVL